MVEQSRAPGPSIRPAVATVTASGRLWSWRSLGLLIAIGAVLGVDWLFPLRGRLSIGLTVAITALSLPWAAHVLRNDAADPARALAGDSLARARASLPAHFGVILLAVGFLIAKWLTLYYSNASHADFAASSQTYTLALAIVMVLGLAGRGLRMTRFLSAASEHPARLMALSFGATGTLGALLLSLPFSMETLQSVSLVDNLFMAFSAVCVTGLSVTNVSETYTLFGEIVICALVQIGGLGIMVLSAAVALLAGQRLRVKSSAVLAQMVDASSIASLRRTVTVICVYTLLIEAIGAAVLHTQFRAHPEILRQSGHELAGPGSVLWASIFHAVSAFCNAGFSNIHAGLVPFVGNPVILLAVTLLIVLGGIGFPVLDELGRVLLLRLRRRRAPVLSLNTRVALWTTALMLSVMTVGYCLLEWTRSMAALPYADRLSAALFQSASARTAGFNVVDIGAMLPATLVLTCAAMFIGACPGSTGGGIKTTTFAALYAGMRAELRASPPTLLDRRVPEAVIRKAVGVAFLSLGIVTAGFFLLLLFESHPPLDLAFETTSAFSTTGLSTGITPRLTVPGKLLITLMMFIGRIGPLTLALAVSATVRERTLELPQERVMIG